MPLIQGTLVLHALGNHSLCCSTNQLNVQPERLTTFEKWFSHEFAVPVPANPEKKNSGGSAIEKVANRPVVQKTSVRHT